MPVERGSMYVLRVGHIKVYNEASAIAHRWFGYCNGIASWHEPSKQFPYMDDHHRSLGSHRRWQNDLWRIGQQSFQPCLGGSLLPLGKLPCSHDLMASSWSAGSIPRCRDRCHTVEPYEVGYQEWRRQRVG